MNGYFHSNSGCTTCTMCYLVVHICLIFAVSLAALHKCDGQPNIIHVSTDHDEFQETICSGRLKSNTYLNLSADGYHQVSINFSRFCIIENIDNVTIASSSSSTNASIKCLSLNFGLGFLNITNLSILNINISECGGRLTPLVVKYDNDSRSFFHIPPSQYSVFFFSHIRNLSVKEVSITNYKGYGILITNCLEQSRIDCAIVQDSAYMFADSSPYSSAGSGILAYFHDDASIDHLPRFESSFLSISHSHFTLGVNFLPFNSCLTYDFQTASEFPLVSAAALSIIFAQTTFESHVAIANCSIYGNYGQIGSGIFTTVQR